MMLYWITAGADMKKWDEFNVDKATLETLIDTFQIKLFTYEDAMRICLKNIQDNTSDPYQMVHVTLKYPKKELDFKPYLSVGHNEIKALVTLAWDVEKPSMGKTHTINETLADALKKAEAAKIKFDQLNLIKDYDNQIKQLNNLISKLQNEFNNFKTQAKDDLDNLKLDNQNQVLKALNSKEKEFTEKLIELKKQFETMREAEQKYSQQREDIIKDYQVQVANQKTQIDSLNNDLNQIRTNLNEITSEKNTNQDELNKARQLLIEKELDLTQKINELNELKAKLQAEESNLKSYQEQINQQQLNISNLSSELENIKKTTDAEFEKLKTQNKEAVSEIENLKTQNTVATSEIIKLKKANEDAGNKINRLKTKKNSAVNSHAEATKEINILKNLNNSAKDEITKLTEQHAKITSEIEKLKTQESIERINSAKTQLDLSEQISKLQKELTDNKTKFEEGKHVLIFEHENSLSQKQDQIKSLENELDNIKKDVAKLKNYEEASKIAKNKEAELTKEITKLELELSEELKDFQSQKDALINNHDFLMAEKESQIINLKNQLSDLATKNKNELQAAERNAKGLQQTIKNLQETIIERDNKIKALEADLILKNSSITSHEDTRKRYDEHFIAKEKELVKYKQDYEEAKNALEETKQALEEVKKDFEQERNNFKTLRYSENTVATNTQNLLKNEINKLTNEVKTKEDQLAEKERTLINKVNELEELKKAMQAKIDQAVYNKENEFDQKINTLNENLKELQKKREAAEKNLEQERKILADTKQALEDAKKGFDQERSNFRTLRYSENTVATNIQNSLKYEITKLTNDVKVKEDQLAEKERLLQNETNKLEELEKAMKTQIDDAKKEKEHAVTQAVYNKENEINEEINDLNKRLNELQKTIDDLKKKNQEATTNNLKEKYESNEKIRALESKKSELEKERDNLLQQVEELNISLEEPNDEHIKQAIKVFWKNMKLYAKQQKNTGMPLGNQNTTSTQGPNPDEVNAQGPQKKKFQKAPPLVRSSQTEEEEINTNYEIDRTEDDSVEREISSPRDPQNLSSFQPSSTELPPNSNLDDSSESTTSSTTTYQKTSKKFVTVETSLNPTIISTTNTQATKTLKRGTAVKSNGVFDQLPIKDILQIGGSAFVGILFSSFGGVKAASEALPFVRAPNFVFPTLVSGGTYAVGKLTEFLYRLYKKSSSKNKRKSVQENQPNTAEELNKFFNDADSNYQEEERIEINTQQSNVFTHQFNEQQRKESTAKKKADQPNIPTSKNRNLI